MANSPLPHDPIETLHDNLWVVEGDLPSLPIRRRMTIARLESGGLLLHSPVLLSEPAMAELDALGEVEFIVAPNRFHRLDLAAFAERYPDAKVLCADGSRKAVAKKVEVDGDFGLLPASATVVLEEIEGGKVGEPVMLVRSGDATTAVFCDSLMNIAERPKGLKGFLILALGSVGPPRVSRMGKFALIHDKQAYANHLRRVANDPTLSCIVMSHGELIVEAPGATLRKVADALCPAP